jgi:hypothetical protein
VNTKRLVSYLRPRRSRLWSGHDEDGRYQRPLDKKIVQIIGAHAMKTVLHALLVAAVVATTGAVSAGDSSARNLAKEFREGWNPASQHSVAGGAADVR